MKLKEALIDGHYRGGKFEFDDELIKFFEELVEEEELVDLSEMVSLEFDLNLLGADLQEEREKVRHLKLTMGKIKEKLNEMSTLLQ